MNLTQGVRDRIANGRLPTSKPPTVVRTRGDGAMCSVCDSPILTTERQIEFKSPPRGVLRFHVGCYALWIAVLINHGWLHAA
jgi:hypothetical protein